MLIPGRVYAALVGLLLVVVLGRIAGIFTLYVQADEFVLLDRAVVMNRTGELVGGGRPGLATLVLVPFAAACRNAVDTIVQARVLWTGLVGVSAVTFWALLRGALPPTPHRRVAAFTGLALWVLAPPVLLFSTQVRSDQPAILFGLLAGIALLASRRHVALAAAAGLLFGIGFLFSQKLVYVAGLVAVLAAGQLVLQGDWRPRREAIRAGLTAAAFLLLVVAYRQAVGTLTPSPTLLPLSSQLSVFEYYRAAMGWDHYRRMLPSLLPQIIIVIGLGVLTVRWFRDRSRHGREILVAWAVVAVGTGVMLFHAGRFMYFYMVLGLFPAAVGAMIAGPVLERLGTPRQRSRVLALVWLPLAFPALATVGTLVTRDQQQQQRASLDWVDRTFPPGASGFNNWAALTCRRAERFPVRFGKRIPDEFGGEDREQNVAELIAEFRQRPVVFMIPPIERFPGALQEFWATRYVHYYGGIHVTGRRILGGPGWAGTFEPVVSSEYVWLTSTGSGSLLEVEGYRLEPGSTVLLEGQRMFSLRLPYGGDGMLVMALPDPPARDSVHFFAAY